MCVGGGGGGPAMFRTSRMFPDLPPYLLLFQFHVLLSVQTEELEMGMKTCSLCLYHPAPKCWGTNDSRHFCSHSSMMEGGFGVVRSHLVRRPMNIPHSNCQPPMMTAVWYVIY